MTAVNLNPNIIIWARKKAGFSVDQLAHVMKRDPSEVAAWESGDKYPSYAQLEELAYRHLKIPLAVFFFPEPPDLDDPIAKFRRLSDYEMSRLSPDTLQIIRLSQGYQESLTELIGNTNNKRQIFRDINTRNLKPESLASEVRDYLGITIDQQFQFDGMETAFKAWRHAIENAGVFSFKNSFKDRFISGFCLLHEYFPIIVINNSNSFSRQIFTIIHELSHILYNVHGISDIDESYIERLDVRDKDIETLCNQCTSEFLVPSQTFQHDIPSSFYPDIVPLLADKYSVSREVILRKFLDIGMVSRDYYIDKAYEWNRDYLRSLPKHPGGDWYLTTLSYLGEGYSHLAFDYYYRGHISKEALADHLNINAKNVDKLEAYLIR